MSEMDLSDNSALTALDTPTNPAVVAAAESAKVRIQSAYIMAMKRPRNEDQARADILRACRRPAFADSAIYHVPKGDGIEGLSIRFAEEALRAWKNIFVDTQVIYEDEYTRRMSVGIIDLESNTSYTQQIEIRKVVERRKKGDREVISERKNKQGLTIYILATTEDELRQVEGNMISRVIRNHGLRLLPSDLKEEAEAVARETRKNADAEDPDRAKKQVLDSFGLIGVQPENLNEYLGHKDISLDTITPAQLGEIRSLFTAIRDNDTTWQQALNAVKPAADAEEPKTQAQTMKDGLGNPPPPPPANNEAPATPIPTTDEGRIDVGDGLSIGPPDDDSSAPPEPEEKKTVTPRAMNSNAKTDLNEALGTRGVELKEALEVYLSIIDDDGVHIHVEDTWAAVITGIDQFKAKQGSKFYKWVKTMTKDGFEALRKLKGFAEPETEPAQQDSSSEAPALEGTVEPTGEPIAGTYHPDIQAFLDEWITGGETVESLLGYLGPDQDLNNPSDALVSWFKGAKVSFVIDCAVEKRG